MHYPNNQTGQILIFTMIFMLIIMVFVGGLVGYAGVQVKSHRQAMNREVALNIAEAGAELAIWKMNNQIGYNGETNTVYGAGVYTVTITSISGSRRLVNVHSYVPNATSPIAQRIVQFAVATGTKNIGFNYGAQIDSGGLQMDNGSIINGNVFSNGDITGTGTITNDAIVSGTAKIDGVTVNGNATGHTIKNNTVGLNAYGTSFQSSTVNGDAFVNLLQGPSCHVLGNATYNTKSNCTVDGTLTTPNNNVPADPAYVALPVTPEQVVEWEGQALNGGTTTGDVTVTTNQSLGPRKIIGNLFVDNNVTLNLTGTVWVTGNITFGNNNTIKLDSGYGSLSGIIIAGTNGSSTTGTITPSNNTIIQGSGTSGSYMMMLSQKSGTGSVAITVNNNATGAIFYSPSGLIDVSNNASAKEITAYKLHLNNNASITYDSGLPNSNFASGPGGGWELAAQTWQLLQ